MGGLTRADVLRRGTLGGLTLGIAGSLAAVVAPRATAGELPPGEEDLAIARMGASAELLAIDFYDRAIASGRFTTVQRGYLSGARKAERAHYAALAAPLDAAPPLAEDFRFAYPARTFTTLERIVAVGLKLETILVGVYLGAAAALVDPDLRWLATQIAAAEARHAGVVDAMAGSAGAGVAFPAALDVEQATDALAPYLGE